jgi:hypothetical protein
VDDNEEETVDVLQEEIRDDEISSGHGGLSNHHVRNKRFRQIVADIMKENKRRMGVKKTVKTTLSKDIIQCVYFKGRRFLIKKGEGHVGWRSNDDHD